MFLFFDFCFFFLLKSSGNNETMYIYIKKMRAHIWHYKNRFFFLSHNQDFWLKRKHKNRKEKYFEGEFGYLSRNVGGIILPSLFLFNFFYSSSLWIWIGRRGEYLNKSEQATKRKKLCQMKKRSCKQCGSLEAKAKKKRLLHYVRQSILQFAICCVIHNNHRPPCHLTQQLNKVQLITL